MFVGILFKLVGLSTVGTYDTVEGLRKVPLSDIIDDFIKSSCLKVFWISVTYVLPFVWKWILSRHFE